MPPRRVATISVNLPTELTIDLIQRAFREMQAGTIRLDAENGAVVAATAMSFRSWGENMVATVAATAHGSRVEVSSESSWSTTLADWGKNSYNLRVFERTLRDLEPSYVEQWKKRSQATSSSSAGGHHQQQHQNHRLPRTHEAKHERAYEVLEIKSGASREEIVTAYRRLVKMYHPDRVSGLGQEFKTLAEARTKAIIAAYEELKRNFPDDDGR